MLDETSVSLPDDEDEKRSMVETVIAFFDHDRDGLDPATKKFKVKVLEIDLDKGFNKMRFIASDEFGDGSGYLMNGFAQVMLDAACAVGLIALTRFLSNFSTMEYKVTYYDRIPLNEPLIVTASIIRRSGTATFVESNIYYNNILLANLSQTINLPGLVKSNL